MAKAVFRGNVTIITGASAGIGLELARQLASQGAALVVASRDRPLLEKAADMCRSLGARVLAVPTDVGEKEQCHRLIETAILEFGRLDTLINNAGISMHARFDELQNIDAAEQIMRINYLGSVWCTYYAMPHLKQTGGRIVAVSSLAGKIGVPTRTLYAGSKHAMAGFFDSLRIELEDNGVSITVAYPGFVATDIAERAIGPDGKTLGTRPVQKSAVMTPEECARLILAGAASRRRELIMTPLARVGMLVKAIAPATVDRIASRGVRRGR